MCKFVTRKMMIVLGGALIVLGLIGLFAWRSTHRLTEASAQAANVHQVHVATENLTSALADAEAQRCDHVRTGDARHQQEFQAARGVIDGRLRELREAVGDAPEQQRRLAAVERAVGAKLALWERSFRLKARNRFDVRGQWALTVALREPTRALRQGLDEVNAEEGARLARWNATAQEAAWHTFALIDAGNLFALAGVGLAVCVLRRDVAAWGRAHRETAEEVERQRGQLAIVEERLEQQTGRCRQLEDRLRHAQKLSALGRMVGCVAHDFNNLLTVILNCAAILRATVTTGGPAREVVGHLVKAGEQATALTRRLLTFCRNRPTSPAPLDLNAVVAEMAALAPYLVSHEIELATALAPDLRPVRADRGQVEQVLLNLIVNARDAMPDGGRLLLQTRNLDAGEASPLRAGVLLAVSDTGCGMDEATQARVFEPLFTTKGEGKGTGLGMTIVQEVVQGSGGHVRVVSARGQGTTVQIIFPPEAEGAGAQGGAPPDNVTVLLVDSPELVEGPLLAILRQLGHTVLRAGLAEAVATAREPRQPIHVLIAPLPAADGVGLVQQLTALRPEMRVLYVADGAAPPQVRLGTTGTVLRRPYTLDVLRRTLGEVLSAREAGP